MPSDPPGSRPPPAAAMPDWQPVADWYRAYVAGFSLHGRLPPMMQLKLDHSRRVAEDCRDMAKELGWDPQSVDVAHAAGLLHDVGRYAQFARFATFFDPASLNHGEKGFSVLCEASTFPAIPSALLQPILASVRYHNRRVLPDDLNPANALPLVKLVRDADKLDILYVVNETVRSRRYEDHPEILLNIRIDGEPTPALIREILTTRTGSYENVHSLADMGLMRLCWAYDINIVPAFRRLLSRRLLDDFREALPDTPDIRRILSGVDSHIQDRLAASAAVPPPAWV